MVFGDTSISVDEVLVHVFLLSIPKPGTKQIPLQHIIITSALKQDPKVYYHIFGKIRRCDTKNIYIWKRQ